MTSKRLTGLSYNTARVITEVMALTKDVYRSRKTEKYPRTNENNERNNAEVRVIIANEVFAAEAR